MSHQPPIVIPVPLPEGYPQDAQYVVVALPGITTDPPTLTWRLTFTAGEKAIMAEGEFIPAMNTLMAKVAHDFTVPNIDGAGAVAAMALYDALTQNIVASVLDKAKTLRTPKGGLGKATGQ